MERTEDKLLAEINPDQYLSKETNILTELLEISTQLPDSTSEPSTSLFQSAGVKLLLYFLKNNFLGPRDEDKLSPKIVAKISNSIIAGRPKSVNNAGVSSDESCDDFFNPELLPISPRCCAIEALSLAHDILYSSRDQSPSNPSGHWWAIRCLFVHQLVYGSHRIAQIYAHILKCAEKLVTICPFLALDQNENQNEAVILSGGDNEENGDDDLLQLVRKRLKILFYAELSRIHIFYFSGHLAQPFLDQALALSGLKLGLTGKLGVRLRYQQKETSQLVLSVERTNGPGGAAFPDDPPNCDGIWAGLVTSLPEDALPRNCRNDDENSLNAIKFSTSPETIENGSGMEAIVALTPMVQSLVLIAADYIRRNAPRDNLLDEELAAYLDTILADGKNWCVQTAALVQRSKLECEKSRKVERAMVQVQALVDQCGQDTPGFESRLDLTSFASPLTPIWDLERLFGDLLMQLGCTREALDVFERLCDWESVIKCYTSIGKLDRAESLIRERIALKETPELLCHLGDITLNPEYYDRSWELSKQRFGRAQHCLGMFRLNRKQFPEAIDALKKSTTLSPFGTQSWFNLGYCAMQVEDYELGAKAFHRYVNIQRDSFEAWNNLAACYTHLNRKEKAFNILQEALKWEFENGRLWENFMIVAVETGNFSEAILAYNRLIDIKGRWDDAPILSAIVDFVRKNRHDPEKVGQTLLPRLKELFGRVTSTISNNSFIWFAYARLYEPSGLGGPTSMNGEENDGSVLPVVTDWDDCEKFLRFLTKSIATGAQKPKWCADSAEMCPHLVKRSVELANWCDKVAGSAVAPPQFKMVLNAAKFPIKSVAASLKAYFGETIEGQLESEIFRPDYDSLVEFLKNFNLKK